MEEPKVTLNNSKSTSCDGRVAVSYRGVHKHFGAIRALTDINLDVHAGTVHALVGENGAGKSTLLGLLAGRISPTGGRIDVFGKELEYGQPRASRQAGVVAIYQDLTTVPHMTTQANVFLGQTLSKWGWLSEREMRQRYLDLCQRVGVRAWPDVEAGSLSVADQQLLEVLRALMSEARIILFDEPTSSLAEAEKEALYRLVADLQQQGYTIVFVSHNLDEVFRLADVVTVFRDGRMRATAATADWTKASLVREMIGHDLPSHERAQRCLECEQPLLKAEAVTVPGMIKNVALEVRPGEILGIGGLMGSGRTTLLRALAGLEPEAKGRLWIEGTEHPWPRTTRAARKLRIALVPEDRKLQGLVLQMTAMDNIAMSNYGAVSRAGLVSSGLLRSTAVAAGSRVGFRMERLAEKMSNLSGGNQQKVLLARWMYNVPKVLLADEPTRGIDVGAKEEILAALKRLAGSGMGIVLVSSELEQVTQMSDSVLVLSEGHMAGTLDASERDITVSDILHLAFKVARDPAPLDLN